jgi:DNA-binding response OmpR family regulator
MPERVLHVDDEDAFLDTVRETLEGEGYEVVSFNNLGYAKWAAAEFHFDVFVCDGDIGPDDGREWATELHGAGLTVLVISDKEAPGVPFLCKPFRTEVLLAKLRELTGA